MANLKISQLTANAAKIASTDRVAIAKDTGGGTFASKYVTGAEINEVKLDTSPQLGGDLDVNGFKISSVNDQDVIVNPNGTGITKIESDLHIRDTAGSTAKQVNLYEGFSNGSNYVAIKAANSLSGNTTYTLPSADGTDGQVLKTNGSGTLSWDGPKKYVAILNQTGTSAPTAIVFENTIGTISFNRISTGFYEITSSNLFVNNKMYLHLSNVNGGVSAIYENTNSSIYFDTRDLTSSGNPVSDDLLLNTSIEIRIYP